MIGNLTKAKVTAPVEGYNGMSAGITFVNGVANDTLTDSQLEYFKRHGYKVVTEAKTNPKADKAEDKAPKEPKAEVKTEAEAPADKADKAEDKAEAEKAKE